MIFSKQRLWYNTSRERVISTIRSAPCSPKTVLAQQLLTQIFQNLTTDPRLMYCDEAIFDSAKITHDGQQWIVSFEALVEKRDFKI